jgi:hypothetical protein
VTDYSEQLANLTRRLDTAEAALVALRRGVYGELPNERGFGSVEDRLAAIERTQVGALAAMGEPVVVSAGEASESANELAVVEVEWGKVTAAPDNIPVATIALHPCDKDGFEYASAAHITVYIKNDRSKVQLGSRGWTTSTILSFIRFPWDVGSAPIVVGVLVGEGSLGVGTEYQVIQTQFQDGVLTAMWDYPRLHD